MSLIHLKKKETFSNSTFHIKFNLLSKLLSINNNWKFLIPSIGHFLRIIIFLTKTIYRHFSWEIAIDIEVLHSFEKTLLNRGHLHSLFFSAEMCDYFNPNVFTCAVFFASFKILSFDKYFYMTKLIKWIVSILWFAWMLHQIQMLQNCIPCHFILFQFWV